MARPAVGSAMVWLSPPRAQPVGPVCLFEMRMVAGQFGEEATDGVDADVAPCGDFCCGDVYSSPLQDLDGCGRHLASHDRAKADALGVGDPHDAGDGLLEGSVCPPPPPPTQV